MLGKIKNSDELIAAAEIEEREKGTAFCKGTHSMDAAIKHLCATDLKAANILLDNDFNPKLSDFGLAKLGPVGHNTHVSTRVMGTYGNCAPEYAMSGKLTLKCDVYCFGVVLLELITGRKAIDSTKAHGEQNLEYLASRPYKSGQHSSRIHSPLASP